MSTTSKSPNKVYYSFTPNFIVDLATIQEVDLPKTCVEALDALDFAAMNIKHYYDCKHTAMFLAVGD